MDDYGFVKVLRRDRYESHSRAFDRKRGAELPKPFTERDPQNVPNYSQLPWYIWDDKSKVR
jgi:hypothetical protein